MRSARDSGNLISPLRLSGRLYVSDTGHCAFFRLSGGDCPRQSALMLASGGTALNVMSTSEFYLFADRL